MIVDAIVVPIAQAVFDIFSLILVASIRPWRYLLSSKYRAEIEAEFEKRNSFLKWLYLMWSGVSIVASIAVIVALIWFFADSAQKHKEDSSLRNQAMQKAEQAIASKIKEHREAK